VGVQPGDDGGAVWRADGLGCIGPVEAHALGGEAVEVGGFDFGIAVGGDAVLSILVGEDEEDIGFLFFWIGGVGALRYCQ